MARLRNLNMKAKFADPHGWVNEDDVYYGFIEQMAVAHARRAVEEAAAARRSGGRIRRPRRKGHSGNGGKKFKATKKKD
ncbi:uncharacterized protein N7446_005478 [Penicillium canescens]|uniref:Uncharacterized protein n=1 Tax=Penicillium canescens TaxID=5083 RepID=A0AAD6IHW2_PENCN|nr:uncharacterized protein N7446_005478 [Penicillium canescens]KAJ6050284.1 hypothetical protein N7444_007000 [Penicillium canescens]KAJ6050853.1 hypothetical protein N7460_001387 [Penicillium canescens]KAJ6061358.1 hypothetical protein N7446_005478 [Penicillium canescens]